MTEKITEDMRIEAELAGLSPNQLLPYIATQMKTVKDIVSDKNASDEQKRSRLRLYRKRAITAAKVMYKENPTEYEEFLKRINSFGPFYMTSKECKKKSRAAYSLRQKLRRERD